MGCIKLDILDENLSSLKVVHNSLSVNGESCAGAYLFGFNGQMKDNEVYGTANAYDFGARMYDSRIGKWFSIDPLFMEYPSISPYTSFANNPILFVDSDGRKIWIFAEVTNNDGSKTVLKCQYKDGKLLDDKGNGFMKDNAYIASVNIALNDIKNMNDPELSKRLKTLEDSKEDHIIQMPIADKDGKLDNGNISEDPSFEAMNVPTGSTTSFNPDNWSSPTGEKRNPVVALIHELLGHGYDNDQGLSRRDENFRIKKTKNGISLDEVEAVNIENIGRKKLSLNKKTTYEGKTIPGELLK